MDRKSKKKVTVSLGNVPIGIYRRGPKSKRNSIFHNPEKDRKFYRLFDQPKHQGNYFASKRNFDQKILMNFTSKGLKRDLFFLTLTFNNQDKQLKFTRVS